MPSVSASPTLLQVIENMNIGGAQRSATNLLEISGVDVHLATYDQLPDHADTHYDAVLLHVWCASRDRPTMNWPEPFELSSEQLVVFNHDWRGHLNFGADKYIVYSQFAFANSSADSSIYVVPGGIAARQYVALAPRSANKPLVVGRLSTMLSGKISEAIIHFWKDIPAERFIVGGDGPRRESLRVAFEQDPRFLFPGAIPPREVPQFLRQIDIFLYDTAWHIESFCYVILEAMAAGCVVVARDKGAIRELIKHGDNGFLYTSEQEALSICCHLMNNPNHRVSISHAAHKFALLYSLERFHANVVAVLGWQTRVSQFGFPCNAIRERHSSCSIT